MSVAPDARISLIDLTKQLAFEIDDELKKEICFSETLVISCGHYEGSMDEGSDSESEWTCTSKVPEEREEVKEEEPFEVKDYIPVLEETKEESDDDEDFHFYFFPDCIKPPPSQNSKTSIITVDGLPKVNLAAKRHEICICGKDKKGNCECYTKLPCKCGAKTKYECTCQKLKDICICDELKPNTTCKCQGSKVCVCYPGLPRPKCTCDMVDKPCLCHPEKFPQPVCECKYKPRFGFGDRTRSEIGMEVMMESASEESKTIKSEEKQEPCICQKPDPIQPCLCKKGKKCTCKLATCICGVQKSCVCEPTESKDVICKTEDNKSICSCPIPFECSCNTKTIDCQCFPPQPMCVCGYPEHCKCYAMCDCTDPCICDTKERHLECLCLDKAKQAGKGVVCTCPKDVESKKLKKTRAGKHGYRWCHEVDPKHTYFDYGYDRHNKIDSKEQEKEKFRILGLYDEKEDVCPLHENILPSYEKKVRKPSLDCCSPVGGISISVESLGEDKEKFLVQMVSHSSKEGAKTGTKLVSILDVNLHTLEENRVEFITKRETTKERRSYMAICDSGYYNKITRICADRSVIKRFYHTFEQAHDFLLEGANIVFLRYLALRRYKGTVKTGTVLMDGTICESVYICPGVSQAIVNNTSLFVVKIERHIIEPTGLIHQTLTVLTLRGYLVNHEWADNVYIIHLNPLLRVDPQTDQIEPHAPLRENWRQDLQLLSDYLDYRNIRSSEGARYMAENGALTATIRDYLQAVLLLRPHDVLHFTRHYFSSALSALDLPHDDYFDPCPKHVRYFFFEG